MTLARVRAWFNRLPAVDRDLPLVILNGIAYTPRMVLAEVERGTPLGSRLQSIVEAGYLASTLEEEERLAKLRLLQILSRHPPDKPIVVAIGAPQSRVYTARQLMEEISRQTPVGKQWIESEIKRMRMLMALARR